MEGKNMKKVIFVMSFLLIFSSAFAGLSWCEDSYIVVNTTWYNGSASAQSDDFDGYNLGSLESLTLGGEVQSWDTSGDEAKLGYKFDNNDETISYINLPYLGAAGDNDKWQSNPGSSVNISGLSSGAHTLEVWFLVTDFGPEPDDIVYDSNGGNNYIANFTIPEGEVPITLASFIAEAKNGVVELSWETASETENAHFLIYRDGDIIAQIAGAGTTTETNNYNYTDIAVVSGQVYTYMLSDVSFGGVEIQYDPVMVEVSENTVTADFVLEAAYPNPFNPKTVISMSVFAKASPDKQNTVSSNIDLSIYNTNGEKVATLFSGEKTAGNYKVTWNAANMPSGVYILRMSVGNTRQVQKLMLIR